MTRFDRLKKLVIQLFIVCLIASALVAIVTVLTGETSSILWKALFTLFLAMLHALACLGYLRTSEKTGDENDLSFFSNSVFIILILSFITSIFGVWEIMGWDFVGKLYLTYFVLLFAALHGELLLKSMKFEAYIDQIIYANYVFMILVIALLLPVIFIGSDNFSSFYFRCLAAAGIVDATLSILAVIFQRLYLQKHPTQPSELFALTGSASAASPARRGVSPALIIFGIYLFFQIGIAIVTILVETFANHG